MEPVNGGAEFTRVGVAVQHIRLSSAKIIGSNPIHGTNHGLLAQLVEQVTLNH